MTKYYESLSDTLEPSKYTLSIFDVDVPKETFKGKVQIDLQAVSESPFLELNYRDLTIYQDKISITANGLNVGVSSLEFYPSRESFRINFDEVIAKDAKVVATLEYDGIIQTNMAGFYKSSYEQDGQEKFMLSTQFEATDARRAFPCLDEPEFKAVFEVDVTIRADWTILGNTPVVETTQDQDLKKVKFEVTPKMSTYLLAWACGEFEYIESFTQSLYVNNVPLPVRIYTTPGYLKEAQFASVIAPKIVDYFSKIFEIQYPLPKLDLIAVHSFSHNAMENWGLITYRSTALLFDPEKSASDYKQKVCYVVAHEIAHQWFGNLVTMQWWDELWLNEGFATYAGFAAVDYLFPEWDMFEDFVTTSQFKALSLDGLRNSHPIEVPVKDALDIDQVFDAISYLKGASIIKMVSNFLGKDTFFKGVALYLNRNQYGNATSKDLWGAIEEVSGKPISEMMESWITKIGYPVIQVEMEGPLKFKVTQERFLSSGDVKPEENTTKWFVPLELSTGIKTESSEALVLDEKCSSFEIKDSFFKLNKDTTGFFRVNYSSEILHKSIFPNLNNLSSLDKVGLLSDYTSFANAGIVKPSVLLDLVKFFVDSDAMKDDYIVWNAIGATLTNFTSTFVDLSDELSKFATQVFGEKAISVINSDPQDFVQQKLRRFLLDNALKNNVPEVVAYADKLYKEWRSGNPIDPSQRAFVLTYVAVSLLDDETFEWMLEGVTKPSTLDSREITLSALGNAKDSKYTNKLFEYILDPKIIPTMDAHYISQVLASNKYCSDAFWEFFKNHYDEFYKIMSTNMVVIDRFIGVTFGTSNKKSRAQDIKNFFADKDIHGFERSYAKIVDEVENRSAYYENGKEDVKQWLSENGYK